MATPYLLGLSTRNNKFKEAPANTSATAKNVARIFDSLDIEKDIPFNPGIVPLALGVTEKCYWRIPVFAGAIFAVLMARLLYDSSECEDIVLARRIVAHLTLKSLSSGGSGPSGGPSSGHGGGRGDGPSSGRGGGGVGSREGGSSSAKKGKMSARCVAGGDGAEDSGDSGECSDASGEALCPFPVHLGPYWNVVVPPEDRSQYGQSDCLEIASPTCNLGVMTCQQYTPTMIIPTLKLNATPNSLLTLAIRYIRHEPSRRRQSG